MENNEFWNQAAKGAGVEAADNSETCMGRASKNTEQVFAEGTTELGKGAAVNMDSTIDDAAAVIGSPRMENAGKKLSD